jgi:tetratricopeptide (TPR) repeat protein
MELNNRQEKKGRAAEKRQPLHLLRPVALIILLLFVAGCAATKPSIKEPIAEQKPAEEKKTISRLEGGRTGFVITETADISSPWRADFERAVVLIKDHKETEAISILEEIIRQSPGVTAPYIDLAMAYRHAERFEEAEELLQTALGLVPDHPVANNEYGLLLRQTGRFEEARKVYESTLLLFPEYLPVRRNLGILCELYLQDTACALEQYTTYNQAKPEDESVALWIADLNLRMGNN